MRKIISTSHFLLFIITALLVSGCQNKKEEYDKKKIADMWRTLIVSSEFGYTLYGVKPVSIEAWHKVNLPLSSHSGKSQRIFVGGAKVEWECYQKDHPSAYFSLIFSEYEFMGATIETALLINKPLAEKWFQNHDIPLKESLELEVLKIIKGYNHALIGSLLGFGDNNSKLFQEKIGFMFPLKDNASLPNLELAIQSDPLDLVNAPPFAVDHSHPETQILLKCYNEAEKKVVRLAKSPRFLETVLTLFHTGAND